MNGKMNRVNLSDIIDNYCPSEICQHALGDITQIYERCGPSGLSVQCPECRARGDGVHCGKMFVIGSVRAKEKLCQQSDND